MIISDLEVHNVHAPKRVVMIGMLSSLLMQSESIIYGLVRKCVQLSPFLRQYLYQMWLQIISTTVGIPMGTNCVPFVANLFLFCYERDFMLFQMIINLKLLKPSILLLGIWMTC